MEKIDTESLPFNVEMAENSNLIITAKLTGRSKKEQHLIKQKGSAVRIITFSDEMLKNLDSIKVEYPSVEKTITLGKIIRRVFK